MLMRSLRRLDKVAYQQAESQERRNDERAQDGACHALMPGELRLCGGQILERVALFLIALAHSPLTRPGNGKIHDVPIRS